MANAVAAITIPKNDYWKPYIDKNGKSFMKISGGASLSKVENNQPVDLPIKRFSFKVQKFKKRTNVQYQYMEISVTDEKALNKDDETVGIVTTDLNSLNNDAKKFNDIGVIFSGPQYVEFCKVIRDNYYEFDLQNEEENNEKIDTTGILKMFKDYFDGLLKQCELNMTMLKNDATDDEKKDYENRLAKNVSEALGIIKANDKVVYTIPLSDFNSMIADSDYKKYDSVEIRKQLFTDGDIHCNVGSYSYVVSKSSKKIRVVAFIKSKLDA